MTILDEFSAPILQYRKVKSGGFKCISPQRIHQNGCLIKALCFTATPILSTRVSWPGFTNPFIP
jgi:hypothetical protein